MRSGYGAWSMVWSYVCVSCESGFSVHMAGPGICVLCLADTCASEVHLLYNPVAHYGYLLPNMYLFIADIANPDSFVLSCRTCITIDITHFCEEQRVRMAGLPNKRYIRAHCWGPEAPSRDR